MSTKATDDKVIELIRHYQDYLERHEPLFSKQVIKNREASVRLTENYTPPSLVRYSRRL